MEMDHQWLYVTFLLNSCFIFISTQESIREIFMVNRAFPKINLFCKYVYRTIYLYPLLIGAIILYLSYYGGISQYGMGFAFALSSAFYYILKKKLYIEVKPSNNFTFINHKLLLILNIIFFISFSFSLLILHYSVYHRSILYYFLITISFFSLFIEIIQITSSKYSYFLILKIVFVSLSLSIGRLFNYPYIPGSDINDHLDIVKLIVKNGIVPDYSIADKYSYSCLMHIFIAINDIILSVNLKNLIFYSIILSTTIIISLVIYSIVNKIYNTQIALIAVLYINIADMLFVQNVTNINPSSIVYCFFLVILFCIIQQKNRPKYSSIVVLMIFCMILSHQLSTFCVFVILSTLLLSIIVYKTYFIKILKINLNSKDMELHLYPNTLIIFLISLIFYWSLTGPAFGNSFFDIMIYRLNDTIASMFHEYVSEASVPATDYGTFFSTFNFYSNLLYNLGSNILLMLAIIGILLIIGSKRKSLFDFSYISAIFMLFCFIYVGTYIGLGYLFIPHRFLSFFQFFLAIFASYSTYTIYIISSQNWGKFGLMSIVIFLIFFMITTPYLSNGDAIYSKDMIYRDQLIYSELKSLEWSNYFLENHIIFADSLVNSRSLSTVDFLNISTLQIVDLNLESNSSQNILFRQYVIDNPNLNIGGTFGTISKQNYRERFLNVSLSHEYNLIYSNNYVRIYHKQFEGIPPDFPQ